MATQTDNMTPAEYHAHPAVSQSALGVLMRDPALFHGRYITRTIPPNDSDAFRLGTAFHDLIAGGQQRIVEIPESALTSNGQRRGKAWDAFCVEHAGATLLLPKEYAAIRRMVDAVMENSTARILISATDAVAERPIFWLDLATNLECKALPDLVADCADARWIVDFKTTPDLDTPSLRSTVERYDYHRQAAWYMDALRWLDPLWDLRFLFVFVGKEPPHSVRCVELESAWIERGASLNADAMLDLKRRLVADDWQWPDEIVTLEQPGWAKYREPAC